LFGKKVPAPHAVMPENSDPSGSRATVISRGQWVPRRPRVGIWRRGVRNCL